MGKTNRASTTQSPNQTVKSKRTDQPARNVSNTLGLLRHSFFATRPIRSVAALLLSPRHRLEVGGSGPPSQCAPESLCGGKHDRLADKLCVHTTLARITTLPPLVVTSSPRNCPPLNFPANTQVKVTMIVDWHG